eukprot:gene9132-6419_t
MSSAARHASAFRVGPLTRLRAWWLGADSAENLHRYGERGYFRRLWMDWKGTAVVGGCVFCFAVSVQQSNRANHVLENIELNRQRYYRRIFSPEYVPNAPDAVYDGLKAYSYQDEVSGLRLNADNRLTSNLSPQDLQERLDRASISQEMVDGAQRLLGSPRYTAEEAS